MMTPGFFGRQTRFGKKQRADGGEGETMAYRQHNYSEDIFADTRMSFGEHIEDLRTHLWKAIFGFLVCLFFSLFIGREVLKFIAEPVSVQLDKFYKERVVNIQESLRQGDAGSQEADQPREVMLAFSRKRLEELGWKVPEANQEQEWVGIPVMVPPLSMAIALADAERMVGRRPHLSTLNVQEAFLAYFKVCMLCGFVLGSPWIFYQIWQFVAAGLYPHEKRFVHVYLPFSIGLFLFGVFICQFFVLPKAIEALLWFNQWVGLEPDVRFNEWLGFAILMPLVFGISFQLPLVMLFLERIGLLTVSDYLSKWKISLFLIHVFAAVITPSVDIISMELLALPMFGLYLLGILMCKLKPRDPGLDLDVPDPEESVEV
jgi:sec-independent protein translocase protein TatC